MHTHTGTCRKDQTKQRTQTPSTTQTNGPYGESIANTHHSSDYSPRGSNKTPYDMRKRIN
jgi:hypothetical protein